MTSIVHGERYRDRKNDWLAEEIKKLLALDYESAMRWYRTVGKAVFKRKQDVALLGCNDRFFLLAYLFDRRDVFNEWLYYRVREVEIDPDDYLDLWARFHYKAERYDTPTPTPIGWRKHGELQPGDYVFGPDGNPTRVIARTPDFYDADCYRVTFDKGETIEVSGDHLWSVDLHTKPRVKGAPLNAARPSKRVTKVVSTRELKEYVSQANRRVGKFFPSIPVAPPLAYPARDLLIDPYVFGVWLGDGCSTSGVITQSDDDVAELAGYITAAGYKCRRVTYESNKASVIRIHKDGGGSFVSKLDAVGVRKNKHIPECYSTASIEQRFALLQGLLDTDGSCDTRGTVTFCNANQRLAKDVFLLASGLGLKPSLRSHEGEYKGEPYFYWQVSFQADCDSPYKVFRLRRKAERAERAGRKARRSRYHMIVGVEPIEPARCNCIQVDRADGLYLTGEHCITTHNSTVITYAGIIQEILRDPEITVCIFSHTKDIAEKFLEQIKSELEGNAYLKSIYEDVLYLEPRKESPRWSVDGGIIVKRKTNPKEGTVEAWGLVTAQPTSKHFRLRVYDDIVTPASVTNEEMIKKTTERWELSDNLGDGTAARRWHIGTRYHFGDTYGVILERKSLTPRIYPATDNGRLDGEPVFLPERRWAQIKNDQRSTVSSQMLQNPIAGNENLFKPEWFRPWRIRPSILNVYIMGDPSKGATKHSDRTAIAVVGIDMHGNKYLLDGFRHRMKMSERWQSLKMLHQKWTKTPGVQMVRVGWERFGQQTDDEYFQEKMRLENYSFQIEELAWPREGGNSKKDRVERLEPDFRQGRFYLPGVVREPGEGECLWSIDVEHSQFESKPVKGRFPKDMEAHMNAGQGHLVAKAIWRLDEDKKPYDLTRALIAEMLLFPFAPKDDLVDATSRIYDMEPIAPSHREDAIARDLYEQDYEDA